MNNYYSHTSRNGFVERQYEGVCFVINISICLCTYRKSKKRDNVDVNVDKGKSKKEPVKFSITEEETDALMTTPEIVVDPPSKGNTPDDYSPLKEISHVWSIRIWLRLTGPLTVSFRQIDWAPHSKIIIFWTPTLKNKLALMAKTYIVKKLSRWPFSIERCLAKVGHDHKSRSWPQKYIVSL